MNSHERNGAPGRPILIFPSGMPRSLEYLQKCLNEGKTVIGASSLDYDISKEKYPSWLRLPYITQPEFNLALKKIILQLDIGGIYSPNPVVWDYLNRVLKELVPSVRLVNDSPVNAELNVFRVARNHAHTMLEKPLPLASDLPAKLPLAEIELAALYRHADSIPGMCDHEKFCALYEIARHSTNGDVVEIGSWWGKSAFILARLSHCYAIGNLLCIDPWSSEHLIQNDGKGLVDSVSAQMNAEEALNIFEINLLPYSFNHVNYLRMPSTVGAKHYRDHLSATSASFGTTNYLGRISILHIDGNHSYASAKADILFWHGFVIEGGWIVIDDYIWPYGDGPKRVGDEFLLENHENIVVAFVMGSALFIQLKTVEKNEA